MFTFADLAVVRTEQPALFFIGDTIAGVLDFDDERAVLFFGPQGNRAALRRELGGVNQQVLGDLPQTVFIGPRQWQ